MYFVQICKVNIKKNEYLRKILTVCVATAFSANCMLIPWHKTTRDRLFGSIVAVMFDVVIQPPIITIIQRKYKKKVK